MEKNNLESTASQISKKMGLNSEDLQDIEERLKEIRERTSDFVQKHPLTSIAIAVGVGYLIARIFSGRK